MSNLVRRYSFILALAACSSPSATQDAAPSVRDGWGEHEGFDARVLPDPIAPDAMPPPDAREIPPPGDPEEVGFAFRIGGQYHDQVLRVVSDSETNAIWSATVRGHLSFGGKKILVESPRDSVIAKTRPDGSLAWMKLVSTKGDDEVYALAVGPDDRIGAAASGSGALDLGGGGIEVRGAWVAVMSASGDVHWQVAYRGGSATAIAFDPSGDVYVGGRVWTKIEVGGTTYQDLYDGGGYWVAKLSGTTGAPLWVRRLGQNSEQPAPIGLVADAERVYVQGRFYQTLSYEEDVVATAKSYTAFVMGLESLNGAFGWTKFFEEGSVANDDLVLLDGDIVGSWQLRSGTASFGGFLLTRAADEFTDVVLTRLRANDGAVLWAKRYGDGSNETPAGLDVTESGTLLFALVAGLSGKYDSVELPQFGSADAVILEVSGDGDVLGGVKHGGDYYDWPKSIATGPDGFAYLGGLFDDVFPLPATTLVALEGPGRWFQDGFLARIPLPWRLPRRD